MMLVVVSLVFLMSACLALSAPEPVRGSPETYNAKAPEPYSAGFWSGKKRYYFTNFEDKFAQMSHGKCHESIVQLPDNTTEFPIRGMMFASSFPISREIFEWWKVIPRPTSMRNNPYLCDFVYTKHKPIFTAKGCQVRIAWQITVLLRREYSD